MKEKRVLFSRGEIRFLAASAAALALTFVLALAFGVPLQSSGAAASVEVLPLVQAARVDLNSADAKTLCTLPGIGEKLAQRILDYRALNGPFERLEDVTRVSGITRNTVESWRDLAYVG